MTTMIRTSTQSLGHTEALSGFGGLVADLIERALCSFCQRFKLFWVCILKSRGDRSCVRDTFHISGRSDFTFRNQHLAQRHHSEHAIGKQNVTRRIVYQDLKI